MIIILFLKVWISIEENKINNNNWKIEFYRGVDLQWKQYYKYKNSILFNNHYYLLTYQSKKKKTCIFDPSYMTIQNINVMVFIINIYLFILTNPVKHLIQNTSFYLHNICVCSVYIIM